MAMSWVAARKEPVKKRMAMIRIPFGAGARSPAPIAMIASRDWVQSIQFRLVLYSSIRGPQRNLRTHGIPKRDVSPIPCRETLMSRKNTDEIMRMIV